MMENLRKLKNLLYLPEFFDSLGLFVFSKVSEEIFSLDGAFRCSFNDELLISESDILASHYWLKFRELN